MNFSKSLFFCIAIGMLVGFPFHSNAQETKSKQKTQTQKTPTRKTEKAQKKKAKRAGFVKALEAAVSDLTEDQKTKIKALQSQASARQKEINESVGVTWKMNKEREKALDGMSEDKPWNERNEKASKQAGFNDDQIKSLKKVGEAYRTFRFESMKLLTAEQQAKMPKWYQDDYRISVKKAAKKAEEAEAAKKEAKMKDKTNAK